MPRSCVRPGIFRSGFSFAPITLRGRFYGLPGYYPKPLNIKAKTATTDVGNYQLAGLVASPEIHPTAFGGRDFSDVIRLWEKSLPISIFPSLAVHGFTFRPESFTPLRRIPMRSITAASTTPSTAWRRRSSSFAATTISMD